jgi:antitoxin ParD1/3/4
MNVSLTPELDRFIQEKVASGRYASASEVVREALRLLAERDAEVSAKLAWLREQIDHGFAQLDAGEYVVADRAFFEEVPQRATQRHAG